MKVKINTRKGIWEVKFPPTLVPRSSGGDACESTYTFISRLAGGSSGGDNCDSEGDIGVIIGEGWGIFGYRGCGLLGGVFV